MNNATPARPQDDDNAIRFQRPDWMPAEQWAEIKAATLDHIHATIEAIRGTDAEPDVVDAVAQAEASALAAHNAGTCHLSEWSCSYCEADR